MPRYVAFLRGVSPMSVQMPALKAAFESAGWRDVRTVLSSGNVAFDSPLADEAQIERLAEAAMTRVLGRSFFPVVRASHDLALLLDADPYAAHGIPPHAKCVVTFMRQAPVPRVSLPLAEDHASVFLLAGREAFTAYVPTDRGAVFMKLIERAFGKDVTTRTLETVARCAAA